ncbi:hypothetical protein Trydic_g19730 [Trypoxylus dichotomus]
MHWTRLRQPKNANLFRMRPFNKSTRNCDVFACHPLVLGKIWKRDETDLNSVDVKIMAFAGLVKLVTIAAVVSTQGIFILPIKIFAREHFNDDFIRGGPAGCIDAAKNSGWIMRYSFLTFFEYFIVQTKPTTEDLVLLLLDNYSSHLSIEDSHLCKGSGVILLP